MSALCLHYRTSGQFQKCISKLRKPYIVLIRYARYLVLDSNLEPEHQTWIENLADIWKPSVSNCKSFKWQPFKFEHANLLNVPNLNANILKPDAKFFYIWIIEFVEEWLNWRRNASAQISSMMIVELISLIFLSFITMILKVQFLITQKGNCNIFPPSYKSVLLQILWKMKKKKSKKKRRGKILPHFMSTLPIVMLLLFLILMSFCKWNHNLDLHRNLGILNLESHRNLGTVGSYSRRNLGALRLDSHRNLSS